MRGWSGEREQPGGHKGCPCVGRNLGWTLPPSLPLSSPHARMQISLGNSRLLSTVPENGIATAAVESLLYRAGTTYALTEDALRQPA